MTYYRYSRIQTLQYLIVIVDAGEKKVEQNIPFRRNVLSKETMQNFCDSRILMLNACETLTIV